MERDLTNSRKMWDNVGSIFKPPKLVQNREGTKMAARDCLPIITQLLRNPCNNGFWGPYNLVPPG